MNGVPTTSSFLELELGIRYGGFFLFLQRAADNRYDVDYRFYVHQAHENEGRARHICDTKKGMAEIERDSTQHVQI